MDRDFFTDYNAELKSRSRQLRKNMTRQERHLWYDFLRDYPIKIYRQRSIDWFEEAGEKSKKVGIFRRSLRPQNAMTREQLACTKYMGLDVSVTGQTTCMIQRFQD